MKKTLVLLVALVAACSASAQNLLTNASFDTPAVDFESTEAEYQWADTGWNFWGNIFRQHWSARSGHAGGYLRGWADGAGWAGLYQNVSSTGGIYTFSLWARREQTFAGLNNLEIKLEWLDSTTTNWVDTTTFSYYNTLPADGLWHHVSVTATGTDSRIAYVRPVLAANWSLVNGSLAFDDAQLYPGVYTGATPRLSNPGFEYYTSNGVRGTQWNASGDPFWPLEDPWDVFEWAPRTGRRGLGFKGWLTNYPSYDVTVCQNVTPGTGTFTFAAFLKREAGFLMTNAGVRIDVYDSTFTNLLQSAVTNFIVPADTNWYEYSLTFDITNDATFEVRPAIFAQWVTNSGDDSKALRIDDARLFRGAYQAWEVEGLDYIYHNYTNAGWSTVEQVPGLGGAKFFDYTYHGTNRGYLHVLAPAGAVSGMRMRMYFADSVGETWWDGEWYTNVVIDSTAQFHGYPSDGAVTMDVWRAAFYAPVGWQGNAWYAPAVVTAGDGVEWWLAEELEDPAVNTGVATTNNWPSDPQRFWSQLPYDHDWYFFGTGAIPQRVATDWAYFNHVSTNPATEVIPSFDGTSTFFKVDYETTTTVFQVLAEKPIRDLLSGERIEILMRTSWWDPEDLVWVTDYTPMSWVTNLTLDSMTPFHQLPSAGTHTVDLWRLSWRQPLDNTGVAFTNAITVYHAPLLKVAYSVNTIVDERYLVKQIEGSTNGWGFNSYPENPQYYGRDPVGDHDWTYTNQRPGELPSTDGIPNWWLTKYGLGLTNGVGAGDDDDDTWNNNDEYTADTDPTDTDVHFPNVTSPGDFGLWNLTIGLTTNSRVYDVWWKTNLMDYTEDWTPYGLSLTGNNAGLTLTVTNDALRRFYRTGVRLP